MEIHKPHAAKTWREFFVEIGTIVIGILIALALEQGLEALHEHRIKKEAQEAVRDEAGQNLYWVKVRERNQPCFRQRLAEISDLLDRAERQESFAVAQHVYLPTYAKITSQVWDANGHAGRTSLFTAAEQRNFGNFYFTTGDFQFAQSREADAWAKLGAVRGRAKLTQSAVDTLRQTLAEARFYDWRTVLLIHRTQQWADILHLAPAASGLPGSRGSGAIMALGCPPITDRNDPSHGATGDPLAPPEDVP